MNHYFIKIYFPSRKPKDLWDLLAENQLDEKPDF